MTLDELKKSYEYEMKRSYKPLVEDINWSNKQAYAEWLAQTYFFATHSTRIIGLAGCLFKTDRNDLHTSFLDHAAEEKGHDKVLISDMKEIGFTLEQFTPSMNTLAMYQAQYYQIQNVNPLAVYGYFLFLEGMSLEAGPHICKELAKHYPDKAIKFLKLHVEADEGHVAGHFDRLKIATPDELKMIEENMRLSGQLYRQMNADVVARTTNAKARKAA